MAMLITEFCGRPLSVVYCSSIHSCAFNAPMPRADPRTKAQARDRRPLRGSGALVDICEALEVEQVGNTQIIEQAGFVSGHRGGLQPSALSDLLHRQPAQQLP